MKKSRLLVFAFILFGAFLINTMIVSAGKSNYPYGTEEKCNGWCKTEPCVRDAAHGNEWSCPGNPILTQEDLTDFSAEKGTSLDRLRPGEATTLTYNMPEGEYVSDCFVRVGDENKLKIVEQGRKPSGEHYVTVKAQILTNLPNNVGGQYVNPDNQPVESDGWVYCRVGGYRRQYQWDFLVYLSDSAIGGTTTCANCPAGKCQVKTRGYRYQDVEDAVSCVGRGEMWLGSHLLPEGTPEEELSKYVGCWSAQFQMYCDDDSVANIGNDDKSSEGTAHENDNPYDFDGAEPPRWTHVQPEGQTCIEIVGQSVSRLINLVLLAFRVGAPILVIILSMLDFTKAITSQNADEIKVAGMKLGKRAAVMAVLVLLPVIIRVIGMIAGYDLSCLDATL